MADKEKFYRRGIANIIINISDKEFLHGNGLSGQHRIPARQEGEQFAMLVVYPMPEIQDIGDDRRTVHWLKATPLAMDICGLRSANGQYAQWGVLLCAAEPDLSRDLEKAIEEEIDYLNRNKPRVEYEKDEDGIMGAVNVQKPGVAEKKQKLSDEVRRCRAKFEKECRALVTKEEVAKARAAMMANAARLMADGDTLWAGNELDRRNISENHKWAARLMGQDKPWCYAPVAQFPCPGCGKPCRENVITCGSCGAVYDREMSEYAKMTNAEKARALYPDRYAEPEPVGKK